MFKKHWVLNVLRPTCMGTCLAPEGIQKPLVFQRFRHIAEIIIPPPDTGRRGVFPALIYVRFRLHVFIFFIMTMLKPFVFKGFSNLYHVNLSFHIPNLLKTISFAKVLVLKPIEKTLFF